MPEFRWLTKRLSARNEAECAFRVVEGAQEGLPRRWRHGIAKLSSGQIVLRKQYIGGARIPRPFARPVSIKVSALSAAGRRPHGLKELWSLEARLVVYVITTPTGRIEWAIPQKISDWALAAVSNP